MLYNLYLLEDRPEKVNTFNHVMLPILKAKAKEFDIDVKAPLPNLKECTSKQIIEGLKDPNAIWLVDFQLLEHLVNEEIKFGLSEWIDSQPNQYEINNFTDNLLSTYSRDDEDMFEVSSMVLAFLISNDKPFATISNAGIVRTEQGAALFRKLTAKKLSLMIPEAFVDLQNEDHKEALNAFTNDFISVLKPKNLSASDFLRKMALLTEDDCHNIPSGTNTIKEDAIAKGTWESKRDMPIQLSYLIDFLNYRDSEFKELFFIDDFDKTETSHAIYEILKFMGTSSIDFEIEELQQEENQKIKTIKDTSGSYSISLGGLLLLGFGAHREKTNFKDPAGDKVFIDQIKRLIKLDGDKHSSITRNRENPFIPRCNYKDWIDLSQKIYRIFLCISAYEVKDSEHKKQVGLNQGDATIEYVDIVPKNHELCLSYKIHPNELIEGLIDYTEHLRRLKVPENPGELTTLIVETMLLTQGNVRSKSNQWGKSSSFMIKSSEDETAVHFIFRN